MHLKRLILYAATGGAVIGIVEWFLNMKVAGQSAMGPIASSLSSALVAVLLVLLHSLYVRTISRN